MASCWAWTLLGGMASSYVLSLALVSCVSRVFHSAVSRQEVWLKPRGNDNGNNQHNIIQVSPAASTSPGPSESNPQQMTSLRHFTLSLYILFSHLLFLGNSTIDVDFFTSFVYSGKSKYISKWQIILLYDYANSLIWIFDFSFRKFLILSHFESILRRKGRLPLLPSELPWPWHASCLYTLRKYS